MTGSARRWHRREVWRRVRLLYQALVWVANSPRALVGSYLTLLVTGGVLYSQFENKGFQDSLWWAVVTASTVGYGDTYPTTGPGRVVAGVLISTMVLLVIPLITAHFASKLIVDQDAFRHEEQEEIKGRLREMHAMLRAAGYGELADRADPPGAAEQRPGPAGRAGGPADPQPPGGGDGPQRPGGEAGSGAPGGAGPGAPGGAGPGAPGAGSGAPGGDGAGAGPGAPGGDGGG